MSAVEFNKPVEDKSLRGYVGNYLGELVYGGIDGCITTFAVVAGAMGANLETSIIVILGLANLIADGFAMSVGAYLSAQSEKKMYQKHLKTEFWEVDNTPESGRAEIREIYHQKGFKGELLDQVVDVICSDKQVWVEEMMKNEVEFQEETKSSFFIGLATFIAFNIVGFIPLSIYFFNLMVEVGDPNRLFFISSLLTALGFIVIGTIKAQVTHENRFKSIGETLILGAIAASLAYFIGFGVDNILSN